MHAAHRIKRQKLIVEMVVYSTEAALIPDLLRIDEQELEQSHQSEPDILEPRQVSGRPIFILVSSAFL